MSIEVSKKACEQLARPLQTLMGKGVNNGSVIDTPRHGLVQALRPKPKDAAFSAL